MSCCSAGIGSTAESCACHTQEPGLVCDQHSLLLALGICVPWAGLNKVPTVVICLVLSRFQTWLGAGHSDQRGRGGWIHVQRVPVS